MIARDKLGRNAWELAHYVPLWLGRKRLGGGINHGAVVGAVEWLARLAARHIRHHLIAREVRVAHVVDHDFATTLEGVDEMPLIERLDGQPRHVLRFIDRYDDDLSARLRLPYEIVGEGAEAEEPWH